MSTACRVTLVLSIVFFTFVYILQTSTMSVTGYDVSDLQKQRTVLQHENQRLEVEIAMHRSMTSIENRLTALHMVPAGDDVVYMSTHDTAVARR